MNKRNKLQWLLPAAAAVLAVAIAAAAVILVLSPPRTQTDSGQTDPESSVPQTTQAAAIQPATEPTAPEQSIQEPVVQPETQAVLEITDPDYHAKDAFWSDGSYQQKVTRTADTITVSLFNSNGQEYRRAILYLAAEGGFTQKETTLFDIQGNPVEHCVSTAQGITVALTTWEYTYDDQSRPLSVVCHMTEENPSRSEERYTYFESGGWDWEYKVYNTQNGEEILWAHRTETCDAAGNVLSASTLVEGGISAE